MGGVACEADVIDLVLLWHDGEGVVEQHIGPVDGLEVLLAALAVILEHLEHVAAQMALTGYSLYLPQLLWVSHESVCGIPSLGYPAPRGPAPDAEGRGEEITVVTTIGRLLVDIEACHHRDALVIFIPVEHLLTEGEERLSRHHIVLKHNHFLCQRERPLV